MEKKMNSRTKIKGKMKMKHNRLIFIVTFFTFTVSFLTPVVFNAQSETSQNENLILGEWFPLNISKGGIGNGLTFTVDGKFNSITGAFIIFKYKLEGDTLISISPDSDREGKQKIEITDTKLIISNEATQSELTRISGDSNSGIIGKWTGNHYTGSKQTMYFTTNQNEYFTLPMSSEEGTYKINDSIIELSVRKINKSFQWSVDGDTLTLKEIDADMPEQKYLRLK